MKMRMYAKVKMNVVLVVGFALMASAFAGGAGECESDTKKCTPNLSAFVLSENKVIKDLKKYTSLLVEKSFRFLVMSSVFNTHERDRPGFKKLYRKISDKAWEDAIDLIKYQSRRGSFGCLENPTNNNETSFKTYKDILISNELGSLKTALNFEEIMAKEAHAIHRLVSHAHSSSVHYDPDVAHYLDEKIIEYQSGMLRDLSGYIHNLYEITEEKKQEGDHETTTKTGYDLATHLFDEYLEKAL